ncbi:MAG: HD family phosphohydrolase [Desulfotomaculaceae bacterium]|nr:HD family phosphohydrolase [Desulfotomaculaceae bacterium]
MIELINSNSKLNLKVDSSSAHEYKYCINELVHNENIYSLDGFAHHRNVSRLEHSLHVSYLSYLACKKLGFDYRSAARGGLLHDFYFYDSRVTRPKGGRHCFIHPTIALENANSLFNLNDLEKDIIVKHMWPVTVKMPKYKESFIVTFYDKYCASMEFARYGSKLNVIEQSHIRLANLLNR